jgi:hypothetical protein
MIRETPVMTYWELDSRRLMAAVSRLEKRGVTPDVAAPVTPEDRLAGRDPGLDAALAALAEPRSQPAMALQAAPAI